MAAVVSTLIELDENGVAWISDTKVKVIEVATDKLAHGSRPEEMHCQYPQLSLAQSHAARADYYERGECVEAEVQRRWLEVKEFAAHEADSPLQKRLRELKKKRWA